MSPAKLKSPGIASFETLQSPSNIRGTDLGVGMMVGVAEWGEIGKVQECLSFPDFTMKFGSYLSGYYLAKAANAFFLNGGQKLYVVRTAHYTDVTDKTTLTAVKATKTLQGYDEDVEDQPKVNTLKIDAIGEGARGNKINVTTQKVSSPLNGALAGAETSLVVQNVTGYEIGDVISMDDGVHFIRAIVTAINSGTKTLYFKSVTVTAILDTTPVLTCSVHKGKTTLYTGTTLATGATSARLTNITGFSIGSIVTFVDTQVGAPNSVTAKVTSVNGDVIEFAALGSITSILAANSTVVTQEFDLKINFVNDEVKAYTYLSMEDTNEASYIENKIVNDQYIAVTDLDSTEGDIGDIPISQLQTYLATGADGLASLAATDFIGDQTEKSGLYALDELPDQFAQIGITDSRTAAVQNALLAYADSRLLWAVNCFDFGKTPAEARTIVVDTALLNSSFGEICYPNVKWRSPATNVVQNIPCDGPIMGLNAGVWSDVAKGPHIAAAGVEDGIIRGIEGFESDYTQDREYRDLLYEARINPLYRYAPYGNVKFGIRTLEVDGQFPQIPERVVFLYARHSIVGGTPWVVFKNNDDANRGRLKKTITKFLRGMRVAGMLQGLTDEEAFTVDTDVATVNTVARQEAGEIWGSIGLATKKAGEFVYFEFHKKLSA